MADILAFPRPLAVVRPKPCPMLVAASNAAAATSSLCEAKRLVRDGDTEEAAGRMLDQADTLECLLVAARDTIALTGDQARDRQISNAIAMWLDAHGGHVE